MEMDFSETTSWGIPNLQDWRDADKIRFSEDNFYWRKLMEFTDAFLAVGKERFHTGLTDFHPGADALAAFRDPLHLNMDLFDHPEEVKALRARVDSDYFRIFDQCYRKLAVENRQAVTSWAGVVSSKLWYVPSNDFSCMISPDMFREFFLDGLAEECRFYTNSLYHLDGPDALRHLDALLEIPELNAIQWVYGAGNGRATDWLDVYRKCQKAGKGVQLFPQADEVDTIIGSLRPEGAWCCIHGIRNRAEAEAILRKFEKWV
jgi:hypothetical protein